MLNIGDNVLEKFLIKGMIQYIHKFGYLNDNQFGFTYQKSTTYATKAVKVFIEHGFEKGE